PLAAARAAAAAEGLALELSAVPEGIQARGTVAAAPLLAWVANLRETLGLRAVRAELRRVGDAAGIDAVCAGQPAGARGAAPWPGSRARSPSWCFWPRCCSHACRPAWSMQPSPA